MNRATLFLLLLIVSTMSVLAVDQVTLLSPSNGEFLDSGLVTVQYNVTNETYNPSTCTLYVNDVFNQTDNTITPNAVQEFNFTSPSDAQYNITVNCLLPDVWLKIENESEHNGWNNWYNDSRVTDFVTVGTYGYSVLEEGTITMNDVNFTGIDYIAIDYNVSLTSDSLGIALTDFPAYDVLMSVSGDETQYNRLIDVSSFTGEKQLSILHDLCFGTCPGPETTAHFDNVRLIASSRNVNSSTSNFTVDTISPVITIHANSIENDSFFADATFESSINLSGTFNITDTNIYSINISTDQEQVLYDDSIEVTVYNQTINLNVSSYEVGIHKLNITVQDETQNHEVTTIIPFYVINNSETYAEFSLQQVDAEYELLVAYGTLEFSIATPNAILELNGTNYTATLDSNNATHSKFSYTYSASGPVDNYNLTHEWFFNYSSNTPSALDTFDKTQLFFSSAIGICTPSRNYSVINISYFDETNDQPINVTNALSMSSNDGESIQSLIEVFSGNETDQLCTYIDPSELQVNWDLYGTFSMSKDDFVTRVFDIDILSPITISNSPPAQLDLFLIPINESTTVSYTWQTTNFQDVTGIMKVYKCNDDATQDLVESVPIINGKASANIELFTQLYSYQVVIDDTIYTDASAWTRCHIESETSLSFTLNTQPVNVNEIIGLKSVVCSLEKTGNHTVTMTWGPNPENSVLPIEACLVAHRTSVSGLKEIYNNCTTPSEFTRSIIIDNPHNNYYVKGEIRQNGYSASCGQVSFISALENGGLFGLSGLLAVFLLCSCIVLIFSKTGEMQVTSLAIGIVASYVFGIFNGTWNLTAALIAFLLFVLVIGRYSRK